MRVCRVFSLVAWFSVAKLLPLKDRDLETFRYDQEQPGMLNTFHLPIVSHMNTNESCLSLSSE